MSDRLSELLPWYVNGSLGSEDRAWVERELAARPEARAEVEWYRSLAGRMQERAERVPPTIGLDHAMARIRAEQPTLAHRVRAFFSPFGLRPAVAFAGLAVFAIQSAVIFRLANPPEDEASELRAVKPTVSKDRPMLKVNFAPDAKETDMRLLLVSIQGRLAGGPGQLGDYYVIVLPGKEAAMAEQIKSNPIVQSVTIEPGLPPRE